MRLALTAKAGPDALDFLDLDYFTVVEHNLNRAKTDGPKRGDHFGAGVALGV